MSDIKAIVFDLGGVLIDWNPEYLYKKLCKDDKEMKQFLNEICTSDWNEEQDAGRTIAEGTELLVSKHPKSEQLIRAYYGRWSEMLGGSIEGAVEIFKRLKELNKFPIYALTNWSTETFPIALERYPFLNWFDGIVVSGVEKMRKPALSFYQLLLDRYQLQASQTLFIDDNKRNIEAAKTLGIQTIHFMNPQQLQNELLLWNIN
jgi:2-haloacid dehalogenase